MMAEKKWLVFFLLTIVINLSFMTLFFTTTLNKNQNDTIRRVIFKDPFEFTVTKFLEREGVGSNGRIAIELSALDKKIIIILNLARSYEMPIALIAEPETSAEYRGHLQGEQSTLNSEMNIVHKNARQAITPIPETPTLSEEGTLNLRIKRDHETDSEMNATPSSQTPQLTNSTDRVVEEPTISQTIPMEDQSTDGRFVREALTNSTQSQEITTLDGQAENETSTPPSQTTLLPESTIPSVRVPRIASLDLGLNKNQRANINNNHRAIRALSTSTAETTEVQETTTPQGGDDTERSALDLNSSTETTPRIVRNVQNSIKESVNQEVTRPSGRALREILTQGRMNIKEDSITSIHKKPILREKRLMDGFVKETLSAVMDELEQVKLHAMKRISNLQDEFTFPPPTDPEGTDF